MKILPSHFYNAPFSLRPFARAAILLAMCLMASTVRAAVDAFIWFESVAPVEIIKGDSTDTVFPGKNGWSALKDFSFGVENPTTIGSATGGAGAGKIKFNEFTIKKTTDAASPAFFKDGKQFIWFDDVARFFGVTTSVNGGTLAPGAPVNLHVAPNPGAAIAVGDVNG